MSLWYDRMKRVTVVVGEDAVAESRCDMPSVS